MSAFVKWNSAFQALLNRLGVAASTAEADAATATAKAAAAAASATAAAGSAATAGGHAQASYDSAQEAAQQANTASGHAVTATTKAGQATTAANNAADALAETETLLATMSVPPRTLLVSAGFATTPSTFPNLAAALAQAEALNPTEAAPVKVVLLNAYIPGGTDLAALAADHIHVHDVRRSAITADLNTGGQSLQIRGGVPPVSLAERELFVDLTSEPVKVLVGPTGGGTPVVVSGGAPRTVTLTGMLALTFADGVPTGVVKDGGGAAVVDVVGGTGGAATLAAVLNDTIGLVEIAVLVPGNHAGRIALVEELRSGWEARLSAMGMTNAMQFVSATFGAYDESGEVTPLTFSIVWLSTGAQAEPVPVDHRIVIL